MIKARAHNITKSKEKIAESNKKSFLGIHFAKILNFLRFRVQKISAKKVTVSFGTVILTLAILEILLRILEKDKYDFSACQSLDRNFHHVMIANSTCRFKTDEWDVTYKINSYGLRDEEASSDKVGQFRILLLGDSFAQGYGVEQEESFGEVLESLLNQQGSQQFEIINSGVFGYSPLIEYLYLAKKGLSFKPDVVILAFSLTDFFEDRQRFGELQKSYPDLTPDQLEKEIVKGQVEFDFAKINSSPDRVSPTVTFASQISYQIKRWLRNNFKIYAMFFDFIKKREPSVQQDVIYQGDIDKDILALVRGEKITDYDWQKLWGLPVDHIWAMANLLQAESIPFVVVGIPDAFQVSADEWPGRSALGIPTNFSDPRGDFQEELARRLETLSIPFINLLPKFREADQFPLYYTHDGHWRSTGHKLAAQIIFDWLQKSQFGRIK